MMKHGENEVVMIADARARGAVLGFDWEYRFLSNFGAGAVEMYGILFPTVEHAFAAAKLDPNGGVFTRAEVLAEMRRIAALSSPGEAKKAGRRRTWDGSQPGEKATGAVRPFLRADWDAVKFEMITNLVRRKFAAPQLAQKLLATDDIELFELNTWNDKIWGVIEKDGALIGTNWLGKILMQVRAELRAASDDAS
jgi:ribA/ribD-fused uncharacterized protein